MTKTIQIWFIAITLLSCNQQEKQHDYEPKLRSEWKKVKNHIAQTWHLSKVDTTSWQMPGSLRLPLPYFSIHQGRNVLFGWDTYFTNAGLLLTDSLSAYAKNAVENQFAEIEQIGYVPNASEPWALNRSQTPFLSMMVREVYESMPLDKKWLRQAYDHLRKEYNFWTDTSANAIEDHNTSIKGLQHYYHHASNEELLEFYDQLAPRFGLPDSISNKEQINMGDAWMAEAETGMDFTPRFENRCHQFIALDLNSNLYLYEKNFAWMVKELGLTNAPDWEEKASMRKKLISKYCWNEQRGLFMDYDFVNQRFSKVASIASFYPLWAGLATKEQAKRTFENLPIFEYDFGPTICEKTEQEQHYQWDYPAGWPPIYYLVAKGLINYGYHQEARRIAAKYLDIVTKNFINPEPEYYWVKKDGTMKKQMREPGHVYEKYNVVTGTIYDAEYPSRSFQGWSYGVFIWCENLCEKNGED